MTIQRLGLPGGVIADASPVQRPATSVAELNERAREVLRLVVESYVETGEPVGSRALTRRITETLSPATIRNIMADLQDLGLLYAPHTSAGRLPTEAGLRLFVNGLLEVGNISEQERESIEARCAAVGRSMNEALEQATSLLSGLSRCASVVMAPKTEQPLKHIEFVNLGPGRALVVTVTQSGQVENRLIDTPPGMPASALAEASNYLNSRLSGRTFEEARRLILEDLRLKRAELDDLTARVIESGLATWAGEPGGALIVRGQARLLEDITAIADLERVRLLFDALERGESFARLLELANGAAGVQIFIGADNPMFANTGCSMVVAPFRDSQERILGAIGVIGPTRLNYARIIPLVDYTARTIGRMVG
ncbi:heat-inducible transcription repressor HrcA [Enhydrobacter aerosaccus]|uniref:Heat-inducible transcription repressor HrcA n=1 Tax=Enhydrobacter aerosaccus TaxID=225324 RepID=A0A1T4QPB5_9HYPH|nr:heat-inducible transcriptional repressor HrcA [Enhydrobacter aerosaccus]SKA05457.1 heat-inducible transcription repressor HrcA [Enhydrobacter aerosaccus]